MKPRVYPPAIQALRDEVIAEAATPGHLEVLPVPDAPSEPMPRTPGKRGPKPLLEGERRVRLSAAQVSAVSAVRDVLEATYGIAVTWEQAFEHVLAAGTKVGER